MPVVIWILLAAAIVFVMLSRWGSIHTAFSMRIAVWKMHREQRREAAALLAATRNALRKEVEDHIKRLKLAAEAAIQTHKKALEIVQCREKDGAIAFWVLEPRSPGKPPLMVVSIDLKADEKLWISLSAADRWTAPVIDEATLREAAALIEDMIRGYCFVVICEDGARRVLLPSSSQMISL